MLMQSWSVRIGWKSVEEQSAYGRKRREINEKKTAAHRSEGAADRRPRFVNPQFISILIAVVSCEIDQECQGEGYLKHRVVDQDGLCEVVKERRSYSARRKNSAICCIVYVFTVRALYAGTLVTCWTTAPSHRPCRRSLSALLAILATLTITARCYASTSATHPLVQLNPRPPRPIKFDSNAQHSSKIVLSRSYKILRNVVQSDIRIISRNSKQSLYNQTFNVVAHIGRRKKRQSYTSNTYNPNSLQEDDPKIRTNEIPDYSFATDRNTFSKHFNIFHFGSADTTTNRSSERRTEQPATTPIVNQQSEGVSNKSANVSRAVNDNHLTAIDHQNDRPAPPDSSTFEGSMPPVHGRDNSLNEWSILVLVVSAITLTVALGLVTCVLNHYHRSGAGGTAALDPHDAAQTPTTAPMLSVVSAGAAAGVGGMDRLRGRGAAARDLAATRDHQVRLHTVRTDIAINLPPSIAMPDGEEEHHREHAFTRLHIRDAEQESEILQKCIRPPPNRTVLESESPPPYRSSSAGLLGSIGSSSSSGSSDWTGGTTPLVVRCHSMSSSSSSSTTKRPHHQYESGGVAALGAGPSGQKTDFLQRTVKRFTSKKSQVPTPTAATASPVVIVPLRPRRTSSDQQKGKPSV